MINIILGSRWDIETTNFEKFENWKKELEKENIPLEKFVKYVNEEIFFLPSKNFDNNDFWENMEEERKNFLLAKEKFLKRTVELTDILNKKDNLLDKIGPNYLKELIKLKIKIMGNIELINFWEDFYWGNKLEELEEVIGEEEYNEFLLKRAKLVSNSFLEESNEKKEDVNVRNIRNFLRYAEEFKEAIGEEEYLKLAIPVVEKLVEVDHWTFLDYSESIKEAIGDEEYNKILYNKTEFYLTLGLKYFLRYAEEFKEAIGGEEYNKILSNESESYSKTNTKDFLRYAEEFKNVIGKEKFQENLILVLTDIAKNHSKEFINYVDEMQRSGCPADKIRDLFEENEDKIRSTTEDKNKLNEFLYSYFYNKDKD